MATRIDELADLIHRENGKPELDAVAEIALAVRTPRLGRRRGEEGARSPAGRLRAARRQPVRAPGLPPVRRRRRDRPLELPGIHAAGLDLLRPRGRQRRRVQAERVHPGDRQWLVDAFAEVVPEQPVLQLVAGYGATGHALCTAGVDKLAFTGSTATARRVMAACADRTSRRWSSKCGGKDALIVAEDADLDRCRRRRRYGAGCPTPGRPARASSGSTRWPRSTTNSSAGLPSGRRPGRGGADAGADFGPITMPGQIRGHPAAHRRRSRRAADGRSSAAPSRCSEPYVQPVVLVDVPHDNPANQDETFGPTITITKVRDTDEAVALANDTPLRPRRCSVQRQARARRSPTGSTRGCVSINSAHLLRDGAGAALRRPARQRVRPHPRRRRPA